MNEDQKLNYDICHSQITLIDEEGSFKGVVDRNSAIRHAQEVGLDLVQFSGEEEQFPVCKIIDYGKFKYKQSKKEKKNCHNVIVTKEVRIGHNISDHDLSIKHKMVNKFLSKKYKVRYVLKLKGCPAAHQLQRKIKFRENVNGFLEVAEIGQEESGDKTVSIMLTPKK